MSSGGGTGRRKHKRWFKICPKTKSYSQVETAVHRYLFSRNATDSKYGFKSRGERQYICSPGLTERHEFLDLRIRNCR